MKDCVSLEVAQKLQKAGWNKISYFWWVKDGKTDNGWSCLHESDVFQIGKDVFEKIKTPTATQLAEELPVEIPAKRGGEIFGLQMWRRFEGWDIFYENETTLASIFGSTLPDALGLMMVYLLENKLI